MTDDRLTPEQQSVVDSKSPRLTVRAAAGSGKTRTLVARYVKHVTQDGRSPDQILTITYTKKAAAEMKTRIRDRLLSLGMRDAAQIAETGPIQTIHAFCDRLLRENSISAGIDPKFEIMDTGLSLELLERAFLETIEEDGDRPMVAGLIRELSGILHYEGDGAMQDRLYADVKTVLEKLRGTQHSWSELESIYANPDELSQRVGSDASDPNLSHTCGLVQVALGVWRRFEETMDVRQCFDFAELERRAVELVVNDPQAAERMRRQYKVILVDEAQDLNPMQYQLIDALKIESEMLVGDPQQSIYSFRQADYHRLIMRTEETDTIRLGSNFRSAREIITMVDELFCNWWPDYDPMDAVSDVDGVVEFWDGYGFNLDLVVDMVRSAMDSGYRPGDIAILFRSMGQAVRLPQDVARVGILSRISGGSISYYGKMHVRDLANLLEAVADPANEFALYALLRSPAVGLSLDAIVILANPDRVDRRALLSRLREAKDLALEDQVKLEQFWNWFEPLQRYADRLTAWEVLTEVFRLSPYLERIARQPNGRQALANTRKLLELAVDAREMGPTEFAKKVRLTQRAKDKEGDAPAVDDDQDAVKIMTVHSAKGLEFPVVIAPDLFTNTRKTAKGVLVDQDTGLVYTNLVEGGSKVYADFKTRFEERDRAEDRRILYVALTRAKERLMVCAGKSSRAGFALEITKHLGLDQPNTKWRVVEAANSLSQDLQLNATSPEGLSEEES